MEQKLQWEKRDKLVFQANIMEPIVKAIKASVEQEKDELVRKLNNLKRLGVISISKVELDKQLEAMKIGIKNDHTII